MKLKVYLSHFIIFFLITSLCVEAQENKSKRKKINKNQTTTAIVSCEAVLNNDSKEIELFGEIIDDGGDTIIEKGFVYSIGNDSPTTYDEKIIVDNNNYTLKSKLENLEPNRIYYIRSFAINSKGTSYGNINSVDTSSLADLKIDSKTRIKTYPNPSTNYISLSSLAESKNYVIYTMQGKEMSRGTISNNNKIDVRFLENGLYILKLENLEMVKFIKE
jgi:hypothetical protein